MKVQRKIKKMNNMFKRYDKEKCNNSYFKYFK